MIRYIVRRVLYAIPIVIGVNLITFILFFVVNTPDEVARVMIGEKRATQEAVEKWKREHNYHLPLFHNSSEHGIGRLSQTIFAQKSVRLFLFKFGRSDRENLDIGATILRRMGPSLAITVPMFMVGLVVNITFAMLVAYFRGTYVDFWGVVSCVILMSISSLFYIIGGQYLFSKTLRLVPISGFESGLGAAKFVILPIIIGAVTGIGSGVRWYRTIFLEEINKDYIRTARAKGLSEIKVLLKHGLKNAMIPILTGVVVTIPFLFIGSLLMEAFFAIPGLGSYTIEAIAAQDFAIVRSMVFLGSVLYIIGLILTDISYTIVDPRIRLE